jgi:hypothetical protein
MHIPQVPTAIILPLGHKFTVQYRTKPVLYLSALGQILVKVLSFGVALQITVCSEALEAVWDKAPKGLRVTFLVTSVRMRCFSS